MTAGIVIRAYGRPVAQGSKRHIGGGRMVETARGHKPWRTIVKKAAEDAAQHHDPIGGPVFVRITFTVDRPAAHYRTGRNAHLLRDQAPGFPANRAAGDLDKLVRSCLDSCTDAHVWADDSQVVDMRARKVWAGEHEQALDRPGVRIEVIPLDQAA